MLKNQLPYTKVAEEALAFAATVAKKSKSKYIGTEHILLGLLGTPCIVSSVLSEYKITYEVVKKQIDSIAKSAVSNADVKVGRVRFGYSPRALELLSIAGEEAQRGASSGIGTEHIFTAIMLMEDCLAIRILRMLDMNDDQVMRSLFESMGAEGEAYLQAFEGARENSRPSALARFTHDLTQLAREGYLEPVIGRRTELDRMIRTLARRTKNNPCLTGEPGVGKTAVVELLAQEIAAGNVPDILKNKVVLELDIPAMLAGTRYRGDFEERMEAIIGECAQDGQVLLFIDEIHMLIGAGGAEGTQDAANLLKPALSHGDIQIIGATTTEEYRTQIQKNPALERRLQPITIAEPTEEETIEILKGLRGKYEEFHGVTIDDDALTAAAQMSARYITDRFLPDKAIDVLDEAAARASLSHKKTKKIKVSEKDVAAVVSEWTKIPVSRLSESESKRLMKLEETLHKRVIGQEEAVSAVARAVRRSRVGLKNPSKPIGSFLFLGPTGVGKTELAKVLATTLFGREDAIIRVDMSEYMESYSVSKFIGSAPGYVGYGEGGQLTERVYKNPYSVILFDEIEKAHPDLFPIFLQILDDGHLTDSHGRKIDFKNTIIIMTSNVGAEKIVAPKKLGFAKGEDAESDYKRMKDGVLDEVKKLFRPELLNRIDEMMVFRQLSKEDITGILELQLGDLIERTKQACGVTLEVTASAKKLLIEKGFNPTYGARPLARAIQTELEDPLAMALLSKKVSQSGKVTATAKDGKIVIA